MNRTSQIATVASRTFASGPYLEKLLTELDRAEISARIKSARNQAGLTQPELGELLHVHWRTVQTWEDMKDSRVPWDRLDDIARATSTDRDWILHGDQSEPATVEEIRQLKADVAELRAQVDRVLELLLEADESRAHPERS